MIKSVQVFEGDGQDPRRRRRFPKVIKVTASKPINVRTYIHKKMGDLAHAMVWSDTFTARGLTAITDLDQQLPKIINVRKLTKGNRSKAHALVERVDRCKLDPKGFTIHQPVTVQDIKNILTDINYAIDCL